MEIRKRSNVDYSEREQLMNKLLSYRYTAHNNDKRFYGSLNLIVEVVIPDSEDFIKLLFADGKTSILWLHDGRLPAFKEDLELDLPVTSISRFKENILNDIIATYYEQLVNGD